MLISSELGSNKCPILCVVFSTDHAWLLYYFCKMRDGKSCYFLPLAPPSTCPHRCCVSGVCSPQSVQIYCKMCASPRTNTEPPALGQILPGWRLSVDVLRAVACPAQPPATGRPSHGPWNKRRMLPQRMGRREIEGCSLVADSWHKRTVRSDQPAIELHKNWTCPFCLLVCSTFTAKQTYRPNRHAQYISSYATQLPAELISLWIKRRRCLASLLHAPWSDAVHPILVLILVIGQQM